MQEKATKITGISRRGLLKGLFWAILGGAMATSDLLFLPKKSVAYPMWKGDKPMSTFTSKMFADFVGESFHVEQKSRGKLIADLIEVSDNTGAGPNNKNSNQIDCFSILFRAPLDQPLEQNTYNFFHKKIGTFPLFIVPIGLDEKGRLYEAVFNRLKG